jgi:uncharacterized protein
VRLVRRFLAAAAVFYAVLVASLYVAQRRLLYPRPAPEPVPAEGRRLTASFDGGEVPIWLTGEGDRAVVWFHGNSQQLASTKGAAKAFTKRGFRFVAPEYPGYGMATGAGPTEATILAAAGAAMDALAGEGPLDCVGYSLGTGVAAAMAAEGRCARLALIAAYTSLPDAAAATYPFVPARWLVHDRLDTLARAPRIAVPTLLVHGTRDLIVPIELGREVAAALPDGRLVVREKGHADILDGETFDAIAAFLAGDQAGAR